MSNIIDLDALIKERAPLQIRFLGEDHTVNVFDGALVKSIVDAASDPALNAHQTYSAQISAAIGIPVEDLAAVDVRTLKLVVTKIMEAAFETGESEPKSDAPAK